MEHEQQRQRPRSSRFAVVEKRRQIEFKRNSPYFAEGARANGPYRGYDVAYCLPSEFAQENLFEGIRDEVLDYFADLDIRWHALGFNHLLSSQTFCVNFLFPFSRRPDALRDLVHPAFPRIGQMLPIEGERYVAIEWNGSKNYLGEPGYGKRGAQSTCPDAAVKFRREDGRIQIVLIEWKYTETYRSTSLVKSKHGTDRRRIYQDLYNSDHCPIRKDLLPSFDALFYEPFYQLFREQLLASEMARDPELGADMVSVCHVAPAQHHDGEEVTSPELRQFGDAATEVWKLLLREQDSFLAITTEELFPRVAPVGMESWWHYMGERYSWLGGRSEAQ